MYIHREKLFFVCIFLHFYHSLCFFIISSYIYYLVLIDLKARCKEYIYENILILRYRDSTVSKVLVLYATDHLDTQHYILSSNHTRRHSCAKTEPLSTTWCGHQIKIIYRYTYMTQISIQLHIYIYRNRGFFIYNAH